MLLYSDKVLGIGYFISKMYGGVSDRSGNRAVEVRVEFIALSIVTVCFQSSSAAILKEPKPAAS